MIALVAVSGKIFFTRVSALNNGIWHQRIIIFGVVGPAKAGTFSRVDVLHEVVVSH